MSPWVPGYFARDQYSIHRGDKRALLPWQSFPAGPLFFSFTFLCVIIVLSSISFVFESEFCAVPPTELSAWPSFSLSRRWQCGVGLALLPPLLILLAGAALFVGFIYWHCRACCYAGPPSNKKKNHHGTAIFRGDCTRFVSFKDPVDQERYRGKRIDMETLYEMYFDRKLDFIHPPETRDSAASAGGEAAASPVCLMTEILARRAEFVDYTFSLRTHLRFLLMQWIPDVLTHSRQQDSAQVKDHYDRSKFYAAQEGIAKKGSALSSDQSTPFTSDEAEDDFFGMFLGNAMVYTSGISPTLVSCQQMLFAEQANAPQMRTPLGEETLEQMQECKIKLICRKLRLQRGETHLDIGCGWGTLVNHSAAKYGTVATGVTLSRNQAAYAAATAKKMRIRDHRTTFWCRDYRDIPTNVGVRYNKISCIEMAEHVGVKNFQTFLLQVRDLLEDDGIFLLQIAGLRRAFQYEDLVWGLFMAKYIFPGADASMPLNWVVGQLELAGFEIAQVDNVGIHYSLTLKKWYENWVANRNLIVNKHGERWYRIFHFFLAWSTFIAGTGAATCFQITCHKNLNAFDRRGLGVPGMPVI